MSHQATNWAIRQRGLKPALKIVLWHLADCHNPAHGGAFPSQDYLAAECEVPRSTLNVYLEQLEARGLIARERRRREGSQKQERTRYYFPFEPDFERFSAPKPSPETGHGEQSEPESRNQGEPSPENGESRVQNLDSNLVREPVREPVSEREARERGHAGSEGAGAANVVNADLTKRVQKFCSGDGYREGEWPKWASSTIGHIARQFALLDLEERDAACEGRDAFLAKCRRDRVTRPMPVANYFRDKIWQMLTDADRAAVRPVAGGAPVVSSGKIVVPVFGPAFAAARACALLAGPVDVMLPEDLRERVQATFDVHARRNSHAAQQFMIKHGLTEQNGRLIFPHDFEEQERQRRIVTEGYPEVKRLHEAARERSSVTVAPVFEQLKVLCEPVKVGSEMWLIWQQEHERRGWQCVPTPGSLPVVYFPKGGPEGLEEFERAARSIMAARDEDDAA